MLSEARKKVLLDLFGSPLTVIPIFLGACAFILSWAIGGVTALNVAGAIGFLIGAGSFASRVAIEGEKLVENQRQYEKEEALRKRETTLDQLAEDLKKDRDPRNDECLVQIRALYQSVQEDVHNGLVGAGGYKLLETVERLFELCISQLEETYVLYCRARELEGQAKKLLLADREKKIQQCIETTQHLTNAVAQYRELQSQKETEEISRLRKDLDRQIEVARRLNSKGSDAVRDAEFDKFMNEGQ